jgi:hypothetical protein
MLQFISLLLSGATSAHKEDPQSILYSFIQKIANKIPGWKRNFLISPGKEIMVKMVLSVMPTYLLSIYKMPKWWYKRVDIYRKSFLWRGEDQENVKGGHCLVNWQVYTRPKRSCGGHPGSGKV